MNKWNQILVPNYNDQLNNHFPRIISISKGGVCVCVCVLVTQSCTTLCDRLLCPWNSPGKNTGVGCDSFLQGVFLTHGWNPGFPHCRQSLERLRHQGSPKMRHTEALKIKLLLFFLKICDKYAVRPRKYAKTMQIKHTWHLVI